MLFDILFMLIIAAAVPVIVAGRVADEQTAQGIIDRGDADMVAMGRALIADPFLPAKVAAGEAGDIIRGLQRGLRSRIRAGNGRRVRPEPVVRCGRQV